MALYYLTVKHISRKQGRSSVAAAAYRAGEKLYNQNDGLTHDFTHKTGIKHNEIMLPDTAPPEYADRATLWNAVEKAEEKSTRRNTARTAREIVIALPNELTLDEQKELARGFIRDNFTNNGMCADFSIHTSKHGHKLDDFQIKDTNDTIIHPHNPHAHILLTTRHVGREGFTGKNRDWNKTEQLVHWREEWEKAQNKEYERKGLDIRVSHESLAKQGLDREPTKHLGHEAAALERRGVRTEIGDKNRAIIERNREREQRRERREHEREQNRRRTRDRGRDVGRDQVIFEQPAQREIKPMEQKEREREPQAQEQIDRADEFFYNLASVEREMREPIKNVSDTTSKDYQKYKKKEEFYKERIESRQRELAQQEREERERRRAQEREENRRRDRDREPPRSR